MSLMGFMVPRSAEADAPMDVDTRAEDAPNAEEEQNEAMKRAAEIEAMKRAAEIDFMNSARVYKTGDWLAEVDDWEGCMTEDEANAIASEAREVATSRREPPQKANKANKANKHGFF